MSATGRDGEGIGHAAQDVADLIPVVRRIVGARLGSHPAAEDLVQETLARVLAASDTIEPGMLQPYAIATARNVVASLWREEDRRRRNQHRVVDLSTPELPEDHLVGGEDHGAMTRALAHLSEQERELLIDHEVEGATTRAIAETAGSTAGAVGARLNRVRARLRVEYLLELEDATTVTDRCRPVLLALSGGDQRRQREVGVAQHVLECDLCARLSEPLLERGQGRDDDTVRIAIERDADIVRARGAARELASRLTFGATELTLIATSVSEVCRNIVRFAGRGEVVIELVEQDRRGLRVTARDGGPGIADVDRAMSDGFSTYGGLGLGLPGVRRLMDDFAVLSGTGHGTTVTMTKWERT
ncbi:sigma-70 family RNA polymerase sigma factor [Intrasporangium sp. YIM S08009]|uniref:sigma-70 family RNA polymerase sigma factor n=1 Tax=Intrasporangium zincisolvens TaxID=3080018 RepID=UPI002B05D890|nr:sigma-70 family RNA polymerase sigma factor [Intrasporangium sp. YIM S08009]